VCTREKIQNGKEEQQAWTRLERDHLESNYDGTYIFTAVKKYWITLFWKNLTTIVFYLVRNSKDGKYAKSSLVLDKLLPFEWNMTDVCCCGDHCENRFIRFMQGIPNILFHLLATRVNTNLTTTLSVGAPTAGIFPLLLTIISLIRCKASCTK
jgi:hypothetical protein